MNTSDNALIAVSVVNALIAVALWLLKQSLGRYVKLLDDRFDKTDAKLEDVDGKVDKLSSNLAQKETQIALILRDVGSLMTRQDKLEDRGEGRHEYIKQEMKEFKAVIEAEVRQAQRLQPVPHVPFGRPPYQP